MPKQVLDEIELFTRALNVPEPEAKRIVLSLMFDTGGPL